jgi:trimeric autotransporter adhesin
MRRPLRLLICCEVFMRTLSLALIWFAITACSGGAGKLTPPDEENCEATGDEDGNGLADCRDPVCAAAIACRPACGNGRITTGELCDDGNAVNGDGCDNNCTPSACGNGVMAAAEVCDDGNAVNGDGCDANCTHTGCGNGIMTTGEACDDGNQTSGDGCERTCMVTSRACGNNVVDAGEACDDGNRNDGDGCDSNCTRTGCGNGIMTTGELCDDGNTANWDGCDSTCAPSASAYVKASNTDPGDFAGYRVALSGDGSTLAVFADGESSAATGIDGDQTSNAARSAGAVYVFARTGAVWSQQAYIKPSNTDANDHFGISLALSGDGSTLAVGSRHEASAATGVGGDPTDNSAPRAGAVYVFTRSAAAWSQQAYIKASNAQAGDEFGFSVALSGDGSLLAVSAVGEESAATGVDGEQADNSAPSAGAVYVFARSEAVWAQQSYVKASNTDAGDAFGVSLALSSDGSTLAVGAREEDSATAGDQGDDSAAAAGAIYVFARAGATWAQQAYLKSATPHADDRLGASLALSRDGAILAAGAYGVASSAGAVHVFARAATTWTQQAQLAASNAGPADLFGWSLALSADGGSLAVGAVGESSAATGIGGDQSNNSARSAGAVYVFTRSAAAWDQRFYVKAPNSGAADLFGWSVALSEDGVILAVGAPFESSAATGIDGDQNDNSAGQAGAVYVY